ncbi:MAG: hypothetical protein AAF311_01850 [Pseudomonadota bacterium]
MVYADIVLWAVFGPVALAALAFSVRALFGWAGLSREAREDYAYRRDQGMIPATVGEDAFVAIYRRVNGPRSATYVAATLWGVLLATPVIAKVLEILLDGLWRLSGRSRVFEPGYLVWAFLIFFGLLAAWAALAYLAARRYHRHAPARLEDALRELPDEV